MSSFSGSISHGVPFGKIESQQQLHGQNLISVDVPGYISLLVEEVLHPFYIFQARYCLIDDLFTFLFKCQGCTLGCPNFSTKV